MLCPNKKCKRELPNEAVVCCFCRRVIVRKAPSRRARGNGTGTAQKRGKTWTAIVVLGWKTAKDGHRIPDRATEGGFPTETDALNYCPELRKLGKKRDREKAPVVVRKTVLYYWEQYEDSEEYKKLKSKGGAYTIAHNKMVEIDNKAVNEVTLKELQDLVKAKAPTYYPAKDMKTVLTKIWELAIVDEETTINKGEHITLPPLEEEEGEPFNAAEIKNLWTAYSNGVVWVGYVLLMIYTGMMPGELLICKKDMIDWDAKTIFGCGLKTKKRRESPIAIADFLIPVLQALCEFSPGPKLLTINKDNFYIRYYEILAMCGCRPLTPYSCRHTTATALEMGGKVAPAAIRKVMRQKMMKSTIRYQHADVADAMAAVNTFQPPIAMNGALTTTEPQTVDK